MQRRPTVLSQSTTCHTLEEWSELVTPHPSTCLHPASCNDAGACRLPDDKHVNTLIHNLQRNAQLQSPQLAESLWAKPGLKAELVCVS